MKPFSITEQQNLFARRHIGSSHAQQQQMLKTINYNSIDALIKDTIPSSILDIDGLHLPDALNEQDALQSLSAIAKKNKVYKSYIGEGYYGTYTPTVIQRNLLENPAWYTSYTPYQAEISQGRLESLLNFQTMICDLTKLDIANASLLDEASAAAEAMNICFNLNRDGNNRFFVDSSAFPQTISVIKTRAKLAGISVITGSVSQLHEESDLYMGVLIQYPNREGKIEDYSEIIATLKAKKTTVVMAADILSLVLLKPPGAMGADIAIGNSQRFGVPIGFGGPHAAYIACKNEIKRLLPGRIVGVSKDAQECIAYRLALQTREQHIRRDKATSNICTAQALLANMAACYAVYHGFEGLKEIAYQVHLKTVSLYKALSNYGFKAIHQQFFDTLLIETGQATKNIHIRTNEKKINLGEVDDQHIRIAIDETTQWEDITQLISILTESDAPIIDKGKCCIDTALLRNDQILTHSVFHSYHSETEMLRYLHRLADKDISLTNSMIPLGSCTMKLNASSELLPISWPEFTQIHPFAPHDQSIGYREMIADLENYLAEITGYSAVSLQPNAGSQGEFLGLMVIDAYHKSRNEAHRNLCFIPTSAHGTNPASAKMCGMDIIAIQCDKNGNIDINDLQDKLKQHGDSLAAIMLTYPSTHGVFEEEIRTICKLIHQYGAQVYLDGANLNAMIGLCKPGKFGGDVSHLNLHKTFCIPHGGGGPGVGPVCVAEHLAPFLPGTTKSASQQVGQITAAPWGSASILPITWMYLRMMGTQLTQATQIAILNANYIAMKLGSHYPIVYSGSKGRVAHECIIDCRHFKQSSGIEVEDIAKRLIDYGFHAPTMSFPIAGTLMIEPTESESLTEIDRFCDAMISIRKEIADIENGLSSATDNLLKNAPHPALHLLEDNWQHPYSRLQAAYPLEYLHQTKYWPPVSRVDNVYGDRNLFCSCPEW